MHNSVHSAGSAVPTTPILVVGAGPAGATAARTLAAAGLPVCLLDRSSFPRNKPCGGGISTRVLTRFPYLESALRRITTHMVARLHLEGPDGHSTIIESDGPAALMIRRVEYDALLVSLAVEAGATLVPGVDVVQARQDAARVELVARDGRRFEGAFVVAADGVNSVIARRLGLNPGWPASSVAIDMMEETPRAALRDVDPSTLWVAYGYDARKSQGSSLKSHSSESGNSESCNLKLATSAKRAPEGYAYIFPKRDHVNIGIGYVLSHYRQAIDAAPYQLQRGFISRLRDRGVVVGDSVKQNFTPFLIPVGGPLRETGTRPRAARGRRRRIRERLHGRRDLLRHGVGRPGGARHPRDTTRHQESGQALSPRVRLRNWPRVARFRADSAIPVRGPPQNCPGHLRRES